MHVTGIRGLLWDRDIIIAAVALVLSLLLLGLYLRAVNRSMRRPGAASVPGVVGAVVAVDARRTSSGPPAAPLVISTPIAPQAAGVRTAWSGPRGAAAIQMTAGLLYALMVTLTWGWLVEQQSPGLTMTWQWVALFTLYFAWPVVIAVGLVGTVSWRAAALMALFYAALLAGGTAWALQGTPATPAMVAGSWWHINGPATVLVLIVLARPIRAMGPIVAALTVAAAAGVFGTAGVLDQRMLEWVAGVATDIGLRGSWGGYVAGLVLFGAAALVATIGGFLALRVLGRLYRARWLSDQSIQTDTVWLTFAILQAPAQLPYLGVVVFPVYKLVSWLGHRLLRPAASADADAPRLLLLRVFSLGARSGRLFDRFSRLWRHRGSIRMIAGPDLANATVEPYEFLDFLSGRLQRRFITGPAELDQRLREAERLRDADGRFRVASFYCHDDTWRMALRRLARDSDVVLMDLRGFNRDSQGCIYELAELLEEVHLDRVLLVVDGTTDLPYLTDVLRHSWSRLGDGSVNRGNPQPRVRQLHLRGAHASEIASLTATLLAMHETDRLHRAA